MLLLGRGTEQEYARLFFGIGSAYLLHATPDIVRIAVKMYSTYL